MKTDAFLIKISSCFLLFIVLYLLAVSFLFISWNTPPHKRHGAVNSAAGISIFIESQPDDSYVQLGYIAMATDSITTELAFYQVSKFIARTKKQYPDADGIIFSNLNLHKGAAIKFK